jgi:hypothetical protein
VAIHALITGERRSVTNVAREAE